MIAIFTLINCENSKHPKNVPIEAVYNKKNNTFTHSFKNLRTIWREDGKLIAEIELDDLGNEHGLAKYYSPENGSLLNEGRWNQNKREGLWVWYFPDGKVYYKNEYSATKQRIVWIQTNLIGNEDGLYERYYPSGSIEEIGTYDGGLKVGLWKKFYPNQQIEYMGKYSKNKKMDIWNYYYPNGILEIKETYDSNLKLVERITYFPDGRQNCIINSSEEFKCL